MQNPSRMELDYFTRQQAARTRLGLHGPYPLPTIKLCGRLEIVCTTFVEAYNKLFNVPISEQVRMMEHGGRI